MINLSWTPKRIRYKGNINLKIHCIQEVLKTKTIEYKELKRILPYKKLGIKGLKPGKHIMVVIRVIKGTKVMAIIKRM